MRDRIRRKRWGWVASAVLLCTGSSAWAGGVSRTGESISVTGPFAIHNTPDKRQIPLDALYWLDYGSAKLFATTPEVSKTSEMGGLTSEHSVRDLIADFRLPQGVTPHFMMNCTSLGALGGGSSALVVIETSTKQLAVYWCVAKTTGLNTKPAFDLVQIRSYARPAEDRAPVEAVSAVGSLTIQMTPDKTQVPLDAIYCVESNAQGSTLFTAVPEVRKTGTSTQMIGDVAGRSLVNDFKLPAGTTPKFMINTASLGAPGMGMAALFIQETTTKKLAVYRVSPQSTVNGTKPTIELLQIKTYDEPLPALPTPPSAN